MNEQPEQPKADQPKGGVLTLVCPKCTRQASFPGDTEQSAWDFARYMGWSLRSDGKAICKKCPN